MSEIREYTGFWDYLRLDFPKQLKKFLVSSREAKRRILRYLQETDSPRRGGDIALVCGVTAGHAFPLLHYLEKKGLVSSHEGDDPALRFY